MRTQAWLVLTALLVSAGPLPAGEEPSDAAALQGTWRVDCQQRAGRATARPRNMLWVIEGDTIWRVPDAPEGKKPAEKGAEKSSPPRGLRMTFRLAPERSPKRMDIDGPKKALHYGIYKLEGAGLTVCMGASQPSPSYDKQAKGDESTRPATLSPEAGTVVLLQSVKE
jgi:uncharacterized protein (TIGR03067 family)